MGAWTSTFEVAVLGVACTGELDTATPMAAVSAAPTAIHRRLSLFMTGSSLACKWESQWGAPLMGADVATMRTCGVTSPPGRYHAGITPIDRSGASFDTPSAEIGVLRGVMVHGAPGFAPADSGAGGSMRASRAHFLHAFARSGPLTQLGHWARNCIRPGQAWCAARDLNPEPAD